MKARIYLLVATASTFAIAIADHRCMLNICADAHESLEARAREALANDQLQPFVQRELGRDQAAFKKWLDSRSTDLALFFPIAEVASRSGFNSVLSNEKQLLMAEHAWMREQLALSRPVKPILPNIATFEDAFELDPVARIELVRTILEGTHSAFYDDAHRCLFFMAPSRAACFSDLDTLIATRVRDFPTLLLDEVRPDSATRLYGKRLPRILLLALRGASVEAAGRLRRELESIVDMHKTASDPEFASEVEQWLDENEAFLTIYGRKTDPMIVVDYCSKFLGCPPELASSHAVFTAFNALPAEKRRELAHESAKRRTEAFLKWKQWLATTIEEFKGF